MARTVFHAWSPQRRARSRHDVLNLPRCHAPPIGTNELDATPTRDRRRAVSSGRIDGGSPCTRSWAGAPDLRYRAVVDGMA